MYYQTAIILNSAKVHFMALGKLPEEDEEEKVLSFSPDRKTRDIHEDKFYWMALKKMMSWNL